MVDSKNFLSIYISDLTPEAQKAVLALYGVNPHDRNVMEIINIRPLVNIPKIVDNPEK